MCLGWIHKCGWAPLPRKVAFKDDHFTFLGASEMRSWQLRTSGRFQVRLQVSYALPVTMIKMVGVGYMAKGTDRWQERQTVICCCCSVTKSGPFFRDPMGCSTPGFPILHCLLEFALIPVYWIDDAIQPSHPLSPLLLLPSVFPSNKFSSSESALCIRWPKYWSFSFSINPSNELWGH